MFTKPQVGFEHPAKGSDHCGDCRRFEVRGPETCEIVAGRVLAEDWCRKFLAYAEDAMPAKSVAERKAIAIAEHNPEELYSRDKGLLSMSHSDMHDFASTPEKGLPKYATPKKRTKGFRI